jgi:hypothetical protein
MDERRKPVSAHEILMRARKQLQCARALIEDPGRWTKRALARDANGRPVWPSTRSACAWCALGALLRVGAHARGRRDVRLAASNQARAALARAAYSSMTPPDVRAVGRFNDSIVTDHSDVLALFDRAIEMLDAQLARSSK